MKYIILIYLILSPLADAGWGRLFFSPEERAVARGEASAPQAVWATGSEALRLDGEISRNGKKIRWLNGALSTASVPAGLKVGQTLSRGVRRDVYQTAP
ncbi:hypothetical protein [Iodobacter fluviatilis]|uniref:Uncharacterized protein n=1 Tax=Iodobacter fluviatilis TaxID=537 RepID=A0A377SUE9_9NEIS|nr:hypothetical protein [Iodobacter fluviatilis]TCU85592.1 hypothetical protein EV682_107102 [Iodobacter fluviatilis]STR44960.1 Uncharacterised protein [Iodobacter fluviatilis]